MLSRVLAISFCQWRGRRETEAGVGHVLRVARQVVQGETQPELQRAAALQLDGAQGLRENAESDPVGGGRHVPCRTP